MPVIPGFAFFSPLHTLSPHSCFLSLHVILNTVWGCRKSAELLKYLTDYLCLNWQYCYYLNLEITSQILLPPVIPAYDLSTIATLQGRKEAIEISISILQWSLFPCDNISQGWLPPHDAACSQTAVIWEEKASPDVSMDPPVQTMYTDICASLFVFFSQKFRLTYLCLWCKKCKH